MSESPPRKTEPPDTIELTICPFTGDPWCCACPDEAEWNEAEGCFGPEPPCRGDATPVLYQQVEK